MARKKPRSKANKKADSTRSWKMRRRKKYDKPGQKAPAAGKRGKFWVKGYKRADGTRVKGHWRVSVHNYKAKLKSSRRKKR